MSLLYISFAVGSLALILVVVLFVIVIAQNESQLNQSIPSTPLSTSKQLINAYSSDHVSLTDPPVSMDGVLLEPGHMIFLSNQQEREENGLYEIKTQNNWERAQERGLMFVRGGRQHGQRLLMVDDNSHETIGNVVVDVIEEESTMTVADIVQRGTLIVKSGGISLPEPSEFKGSRVGQVYKFDIMNANPEECVELGHSENWTSSYGKLNHIEPFTGATFVLRITSDTTGQVYRK